MMSRGFLRQLAFSASHGRGGLCTTVAFALCVALLAANADPITTIADNIVRDPVRFAAGALDAPPPGALATDPGAWPPLVPDCTAAYLNATVAAAAPFTTLVRVEVPPGRAVSLRGCQTGSSDAAPMRHVRLVLAMGRSSAVALEAWDVALGGVTIEGPSSNASSVVDALVVVRGGSRIVASTNSTTSTGAKRAASSDPGDDVHVLSVVVPETSAWVSGLGLVVMNSSVVRAQHDGAGVLYASACAVRAEAVQHPSTTASLTLERLRIIITDGSSVEAVSTHSGTAYDANKARRAHAATFQSFPGALVSAARVLVAVLNRSATSVLGDESSTAAGGIGVSSRERGNRASYVPTTVAVSHATLIAAGPNTTVRVTTRGEGAAASAMGVAAAASSGATASMTHATVCAVGPNTTVATHVTGSGYGASTMGVAARVGATASMANTSIYAVGPYTTVAVHVLGGWADGASAMGIAAANSGASASMANATVYAVGPNTTVVVRAAGNGAGASAMGIVAHEGSSASMANTAVYAVGPDTTVATHVTGNGYAASAMGTGVSWSGATASMANTTVLAVGPNTTVAVRSSRRAGVSAMGIGLTDEARGFHATGNNTMARCPNVTITAEGAAGIVVFNATLRPGITFTSPSPCPPVPGIAGLRWFVLGGGDGGGTATDSPSRSAQSASQSRSPSVLKSTATRTGRSPTLTVASSVSALASSTISVTTSFQRTGTPPLPPPAAFAGFSSATVSATSRFPQRPDEASRPATAPAVIVPAGASATAAVVAGVLLPSSASKPMANARALQAAGVCLSAAGEVLEDAEAGEWPSDYAVIVARWELGAGGDDAGARARAAGAAVAVACAVVAAVGTVVRFAACEYPASLAVAFAVAAAYLLPNALEAAAVAATAGLSGTTGVAGVVAGCAMAAAAGLIFSASVPSAAGGADDDAQELIAPSSSASSTTVGQVVGRVARFLHPVLVDGLRDTAAPLLRAHALLDVGAACFIAVVSGMMQGGVRVGGSCVLLVVVMAAAAAGLTAYYALVRPFAARLEAIVATAQAGMLAVLCGLTLATVASGGTAVSGSTLELAGLAAEAVSFGAPVVLVVPVAWAWLRGGSRDGATRKTADASSGAVPRVVAGGAAPANGDVGAPLLTFPGQPRPSTAQRNGGKQRAADGGSDNDEVRSNPLAASSNRARGSKDVKR